METSHGDNPLTCRRPGGGQRGYTMVELMFTVAIAALVTGLAVPNFRSFVLNNRAAEESNALVGALALARSESVTRGIPVSVCASSDNATCANSTDWTTGWIVFTDVNAPIGAVDTGTVPDTVLRALPALGNGSSLTATANFVSYAANGFLANAAGVDFSLAISGCTGDHNRDITVNLQGRAAVAAAPCT
ncbi:MAG: prepilin-type N-terminal cleavage/methylation domain-containing protein [Gammaproteobacteria bacterium PRO9]|nr:prepilin-type N-terminal cleavage/methylation domain-containing protein [Gammaproteobacteria bacterium PRO9]